MKQFVPMGTRGSVAPGNTRITPSLNFLGEGPTQKMCPFNQTLHDFTSFHIQICNFCVYSPLFHQITTNKDFLT